MLSLIIASCIVQANGEVPQSPISHDATNTIIAVIIFVLGFYITNLISKNNKRKELELYKLLIIDWTRSMQQSINSYIENIDLFAKNIKENDSLNIAQYISNVINMKRLGLLPIDKVTDALVVNLKANKKSESIKHLYNYLLQLDYFEGAIEDIWKKYETYCDECEVLREEWNRAYIPLNTLLIERHSQPKEEYTELEIEFLDAIESRFYALLRTKEDELEEIKISVWDEQFIKPAYQLLSSNDDFSKSIKLRPFINLINELHIVRFKHDSNKRFSDVFLRSSGMMKKAQRILLESVDYFANHNIKSFFCIK